MPTRRRASHRRAGDCARRSSIQSFIRPKKPIAAFADSAGRNSSGGPHHYLRTPPSRRLVRQRGVRGGPPEDGAAGGTTARIARMTTFDICRLTAAPAPPGQPGAIPSAVVAGPSSDIARSPRRLPRRFGRRSRQPAPGYFFASRSRSSAVNARERSYGRAPNAVSGLAIRLKRMDMKFVIRSDSRKVDKLSSPSIIRPVRPLARHLDDSRNSHHMAIAPWSQAPAG